MSHKPHIPDSPETQQHDPAIMKMVSTFQCPGCLHGTSPSCGQFRNEPGRPWCIKHRCGTFLPLVGWLAIGLPKGFNRCGFGDDDGPTSKFRVRLWKRGTSPGWNQLNVAVWALERGGYLFVRTVMPRIGMVLVDVIEGGTLADVPGAMNTADFKEEFD